MFFSYYLIVAELMFFLFANVSPAFSIDKLDENFNSHCRNVWASKYRYCNL